MITFKCWQAKEIKHVSKKKNNKTPCATISLLNEPCLDKIDSLIKKKKQNLMMCSQKSVGL
jgi:hypothetical protein